MLDPIWSTSFSLLFPTLRCCSYTREFNLDKNTHLVAETAQGAKYQLAVSCKSIQVITPSWLDACAKSGERVDERAYVLLPKTKSAKTPPTTSQVDELLVAGLSLETRSLFECRKFYLLGFEEDIELKQKLGRLIRRGLGTIYWEMNDEVSIMILHDTCDDTLR
jgi:hypothetical protein